MLRSHKPTIKRRLKARFTHLPPSTRLAEELIAERREEAKQKSIPAGAHVDGMGEDLEALGLEILPFTAEEAEIAARLWQRTRQYELSLGDRACLGLGFRLKASVLTVDRIWTAFNLPVTVQSIRQPI